MHPTTSRVGKRRLALRDQFRLYDERFLLEKMLYGAYLLGVTETRQPRRHSRRL
jgi:hypothetical protein